MPFKGRFGHKSSLEVPSLEQGCIDERELQYQVGIAHQAMFDELARTMDVCAFLLNKHTTNIIVQGSEKYTITRLHPSERTRVVAVNGNQIVDYSIGEHDFTILRKEVDSNGRRRDLSDFRAVRIAPYGHTVAEITDCTEQLGVLQEVMLCGAGYIPERATITIPAPRVAIGRLAARHSAV